MTNWRTVKQWNHQGEGDAFGLCFFAMFGNWLILQGGAVMPDGEIENAARVMEGFNPYDPSTDHGEYLDAGLRYITTKGWPGDPMLKPASFREMPIVDAMRDYGVAMAWCMLPMDNDGDPDLSDGAVARGRDGTAAHAVLVVEAVNGGYWLITWAEPRFVSGAWWARYGRQAFVVEGVQA